MKNFAYPQDSTEKRTNEIQALKQEYDWVIQFEGHRVFQKVENVLKDCCKRIPLPNKVAPYVAVSSGGQAPGLQPEKFMLTSNNSDAVRCMLTLLGDNVVQAEVAIRYAKAPGHIFRSTAQPDVQWKIQQIQDLGNYVLKAMESVKSASQLISATKRWNTSRRSHFSPEICVGGSSVVPWQSANKDVQRNRQLIQYIVEVIRDLQNARNCLMAPKKRSIIELQEYRPNKCFNPPLPQDMLLSFYIVSQKLICAAYVLQEGAIGGKHTFQVMLGECGVQWLNDVLSLLNSALLLSQQFKDKLDIFYECKELREHIHGQKEETRMRMSENETETLEGGSEDVFMVHM